MTKFQKIAFLFPGQGAQYVGMGRDFYESDPTVRQTFEEADDLLGRHLSKIVLSGQPEELTLTSNSQPAIYLLSIAYLRSLKQHFPFLKPSFAAGLSLGEYSALACAGILSEQAGLKLVEKRGRYMSEACDQSKGAMSAILGLSQAEVEKLVAEAKAPNDLWAANFNSPGQTVISGTLKGIEIGTELAQARGAKKVIPLQVHGAFHSGLMKPAEIKLRESVLAATFYPSEIKVVMNASGTFAASLDETREWLIKQVVSPVRWQESIQKLTEQNVDLFVEIGCGKTLSALNKRNGVLAPTLSIEKFSDLELFAKELQV